MSREQAFAKVDIMTAELEMTASIYDGFSTAIVVKDQPRTVGLFREFDDAVQVMALIERARGLAAGTAQASDKATEHRQGNGPRASVGDQPAQAEREPNGRPSSKTDQEGGGSPNPGRRGAILAGGAQLGERTVGAGRVEELSEGAAAPSAAQTFDGTLPPALNDYRAEDEVRMTEPCHGGVYPDEDSEEEQRTSQPGARGRIDSIAFLGDRQGWSVTVEILDGPGEGVVNVFDEMDPSFPFEPWASGAQLAEDEDELLTQRALQRDRETYDGEGD